MKVKRYDNPSRLEYLFTCPGCNRIHTFITEWKPLADRKEPIWSFNGDVDNPTFSPSLLYNKGRLNPESPICHSYVTNGKIEFLSDSTHHLAGKTVALPDL